MNNTLRDPDKITMTHTGLLPGKKGKLIHVSFERKTERGRDFAELVLPSRNVLSSKDIIQNAKQINHDMIFKL